MIALETPRGEPAAAPILRAALDTPLGLLYVLASPTLWPYVAVPLLVTLAVGGASTVLLLVYALGPLAAWLDARLLPAFASYPAAVVILLGAAYAGSMLLVGELFATTRAWLLLEVLKRRGVKVEGALTLGQVVGTGLKKVVVRTVVLVVTLPLHLVPVIGTAAFVAINGYFLAWDTIGIYLEARGLAYDEQKRLLEGRALECVAFGAAATLLGLVPFLGLLAPFGAAAGGGFWAARLHRAEEASA